MLEVVSLIFSSVGLLFSSKFSVGVSAGVCIGFGVIIPITSIVGTFSSKPAYDDISSYNTTLNYALNSRAIIGLNKNDLPTDAQSAYENLPNLKDGGLFNIGVSTNDKDSFK